MKRRLFWVALALFSIASVARADRSGPLGKWMKANMAPAVLAQDFPRLAANFELVGSRPPPGDYPQWGAITSRGVAAARANDLGAVKSTCRTCHETYREKYRREHPGRPFP